jgi:colanic acid biosynthesis glycosyl transferase WcaI
VRLATTRKDYPCTPCPAEADTDGAWHTGAQAERAIVKVCVLMRIQLWSYNYDPEPQGIAPLSRMLAMELAARGHEILVIAAHPHYPQASWGVRARPYRETRDGIPVIRLPLWIGRDNGAERMRQDVSFALMQSLAAPLLPSADAVIAVTPCFPALGPAMLFSRARRTPWIMWVQDIVTDGAATTGLIENSRLLRVANGFERMTYKSASRIVVISEAFRQNLEAKGVPGGKIVRIFNPSSREASEPVDLDKALDKPRILAMGNIGHSQGLDRIVEAFQGSADLDALGAELVIAGHGVAADDVRAAVRSDRVSMPGVLYGEQLEPELRGASIGLVSQRAGIQEFNLPSKLMNYLAYGLPVIASVDPESETARIVQRSGAGWVTDARDPSQFASLAAAKLNDAGALKAASDAGFRYANDNFHPRAVAAKFDEVLVDVIGGT